MLQEINRQILLNLNSLTSLEFIEKTVYIFADAPIFFLPIFLVIMWIYHTHFHSTYAPIIEQKKEKLLLIFYSCVIWIIIALIIQQFVTLERPESFIENYWKLLISHIPDASFPSDHATVSFAFLTSLFLAWYKKTWLLFLPFVIIMNLSRVIAWIHWPFDIVAWLLVWIFSAIITFKILGENKLVKKLNLWIIKTISIFKL